MKDLNNFIQEKLKVNSKTKINNEYITYKEFLDDNNIQQYKEESKNTKIYSSIKANLSDNSEIKKRLISIFRNSDINDKFNKEINKYIEKENTLSEEYGIRITFKERFIEFIIYRKNDHIAISSIRTSPQNYNKQRINNIYCYFMTYSFYEYSEVAEKLLINTFNLLFI